MNKKHHRSQITQIPIYLGKFFRMFIFLDDWKVIPMAAIISGIVGYVISKMMFSSMEGTVKGALAIACVCVWNGCFNSIQVVCRERGIIKREHRSGMYITSYILSHMIYQAFLCLLQTIVMLLVFYFGNMNFPHTGLITPIFLLDFAITIFLITYASDMMSLLISCIAKTTTAAMTVMPFVLIFQLVFAGTVFQLTGSAKTLTNFSIAKWGIQCICAQSDYNALPMKSAWTMLKAMENYEVEGQKPLKLLLETHDEKECEEIVGMEAASQNQKPEYASTTDNVKNCWFILIIFSIVEALLAMQALKRIDKDKR